LLKTRVLEWDVLYSGISVTRKLSAKAFFPSFSQLYFDHDTI
jgi:hypothetical protein